MTVNHDDPAAVAAFAALILRTHPHLVLGTATPAGQPWAVPVHQTTEPSGRLHWRSAIGTRHSQNLLTNPQASGVLYSSTREWGEASLFLEGHAETVNDEATVRSLLAVRYRDQPHLTPPAAELLDDALYRLYIFTTTAAWINDDTHTKTAVNLAQLRHCLSRGGAPTMTVHRID